MRGLIVANRAPVAVAAAPYPADRIDRRIAVMGMALAGALVCIVSLFLPGRDALNLRLEVMAAVSVPVHTVCLAHADDQLTRAHVVSAGGGPSEVGDHGGRARSRGIWPARRRKFARIRVKREFLAGGCPGAVNSTGFRMRPDADWRKP